MNHSVNILNFPALFLFLFQVLRSILDINSLTTQIHKELDAEMKDRTEMAELNKYYFDGKGKSVRPVIAMTLGEIYITK